MWDENIERHCAKLWKSVDTVFVLMQFQHDRQKVVFSARKHNVKSITCRANVLYTTTFLCRSSTLTICHDVADIDMTTTTRRRRHVVAAQKHENWMPKCQHLAHTCSSLERFYAVNVGDMSCRVVADVDMATRTCRRRVKKTTRRANTSDKTTTLSAEITLKYIVFNSKRVTKTPCGRAERWTKRRHVAQTLLTKRRLCPQKTR